MASEGNIKSSRPSKEHQLLMSTVGVIGFLLISAWHILRAIYNFFLPEKYKALKNLHGEIALITGGGGGLGRLLALRLCKLGATVVLWDVNTEAIEETVTLVKGIGGAAYGYTCDLVDRDDVYRVAKITQREIGDITLLINNAGVSSAKGFLLDTPDHLIQRTFDVNILAHFWTVKAFLPKMIENGHGHIVTVASMAGHVGINKLTDYCSSKFAAVGFDEALRAELEAQRVKGVLTTAICPYFIQSTGMFDTVESRFLPRLKSNDVADRIVDGIRKNEKMIMIPGALRIGLIFKFLVPSTVISKFLRGLVPDAVPDPRQTASVESEEEELANLRDAKPIGNSLVDSVSHLSRNSPIGKNL